MFLRGGYGLPAEYRIDDASNTVLSRAWGRLTDEDLLDHQQRLHADPAFRRDMQELFDLYDVEEVELTTDGIRAFAAATRFDERARRAFVVRQPAMFGLARMLQILTEDVVPDTVVQMDDHARAREWLGIQVGGKEK